MSDFEAELDALASNLPSEANLPYTKGDCINKLTLLLSISFAEKDVKPRFQSVKLESVGKSFSESLKKTGGQDKNKYQICVVKDLGKGDVSKLCRQKRSGSKNTFCLKEDCTTDHRNFNALPIDLDRNAIIVLRSSDAAFLEPISSLNFVKDELLEEWKDMSLTLVA